MKENPPYIGDTGFMSGDEVKKVLSEFPKNSDRMLMVGVLASTTTINGGRPGRFSGRYPAIEDIKNIFVPDPRALNIIHFNDKTNIDALILEQLFTLTKKSGSSLNGFQLNIKWPNPEIIRDYLSAFYEKKIILQIGGGAFKAVNRDPRLMAKKINDEYDGLVDYILFDPSGGEGKELEVQMALRCLDALETICSPRIGLGIAGGFYHGNLEKLLLPIAREHPDVSIDAEGKLRDWEKGDTLNIERTIRFTQAAYDLFVKIQEGRNG